MDKIRIIAVPPGFAPFPIRIEWVGVEIPLPSDEVLKSNPPSDMRVGSKNLNGYMVTRTDAIAALRAKDNQDAHEAADFWESMPIGFYLMFNKDVCELV